MSSLPRLPRAAVAPAFALAAAVLMFAAGCSDDEPGPTGPPPAYSSITITGADTVLIGATATFTAVVLDTAGQVVASPALTWSSSSTAIATVNNGGGASGVSEGDVQIRAAGGGATSNAGNLAVIQGQGWVDQSDAVASLVNLRGVHFVSARQGWIVGAQGTILTTTDAGKTWTTQPSNSTGYTLNAVDFATSAVGIVVGTAGRVLRTTNSGTSWGVLTVDTDGGKGLNDVFFQDANQGWIVGNGGLILRTTNNGATWTRVLPGVTSANLQSVFFPDASGTAVLPSEPYARGWIVGDGGTILSSDDFGQSWRIVTPFAASDDLLGVSRRTTADAIAVGANNRVVLTAASGDTALWSLAPSPTPFTNFTSVAWPATSPLPGSAWAAGKRTDGSIPVVLYSADGGQSWTEQVLPNDAPLLSNGIEDVYFLDDRRGWAVGTSGLVLHTATGGR
jgi:photosystem II stability/assembly factor-like uncharacterized protein